MKMNPKEPPLTQSTRLTAASLRHAALARDYLACLETLADLTGASDEATGVLAHIAVRQALLAHAAAHGRRCPDCRTVRDTARYAGVTTLTPIRMLDQYGSSAAPDGAGEPIRQMGKYLDLIRLDVCALLMEATTALEQLTGPPADQAAPPWGSDGRGGAARKPENE